MCHIACIHVLVPCCDVRYERYVICIYLSPMQFSFQIMFLSFKGNTTSSTSGAGSAYSSGAHELTYSLCSESCWSISRFLVVFYRLLFVILFFFIWSMYCLFFFHQQLLDNRFGIFKLFWFVFPITDHMLTNICAVVYHMLKQGQIEFE